jgi:tellurite resistance protein TerC
MLTLWIAFVAFILLMLAIDLGVFHRRAHVVEFKESLVWSAVWIAMGLAFGAFVYYGYETRAFGLGSAIDVADGTSNDGSAALVKYLTGYVIEKSLSVDNIFVIAMIFGFFAVPPIYQHRVLFWGILGALVMRGTMIGVGAALISQFHWILYVFAALLILTSVKMMLLKEEHMDPDRNIVLRFVRHLFPVTARFHGEHFFVRAGTAASAEPETPGAALIPDHVVDRARAGTLLMTPLFLALIMVEVTDLIFAVDSIPAIFAITADPFLVFTSNVFALLGLRSLYFALAGMIRKFRHLKVALAGVLMVVGLKMLFAEWLKATIGKEFNLYLLGVVLFILAAGVVSSLIADRRDSAARQREPLVTGS